MLATKLHPPRPRRGLVERPRLTERAALDRLPSLTLVCAPAGFGKTTLLAELIDAAGAARVAWLALDAGDNDPAVFWTYVVRALQTVEPAAGEEALVLLQAAQPATAVVSALLNDLAAADREVVLVLDDYHVIESTEIHDAVTFLLDHAPPQVHVVLAGRADPPFPLARLRARGELLEIRAADLRFTPEEAARYCNESMGLQLSAADVGALERRTEGWVAALQLAALSMQGREDASGFIATFAGDDRFVVDYLAEEVLERQPDDVRRFLLQTAILDRFTASLCDAVTGVDGSKAMLDRLDRANLFLVPLDDRRHWYRYHHLFADVLRARLADEDPGSLDELHRRASAWYEAAGDAPEAVAHALAGHDPERAARLIELAAPTLFQARQEWTARRWLTALPDDLYADRPVLAVLLAGALMVSGEATGVERLLDGIERRLDPGRSDPPIVFDEDTFRRLPAQVAVYRAALALIAGDLDATVAHATRALDLVEPTDHLRRGSASALVGLARWTIGDLDAATRCYADAIDALTAAGHVSDVLGCSIALADMRLAQGRLRDAQRIHESALELARPHGALRGTADMHAGLAEVLLRRDDLAGAREHLDVAAQLGEQAGLPQHPYRWRVTTARLRLAEGDTAAALELLAEAERVYNTDLSPPVRPVAAVLAGAQLAAGDLDAARQWVRRAGLGPDDELSYVREYEHLTLARVLLAEGAADTAARLAARLRAAAEAGRRNGSVTEILVVLALAQDAAGEPSAAVASLDAALDLAAPEGAVRVFADELPALAPRLREAGASPAARDLARQLLDRTAPGVPAAASAPPTTAAATPRLVDPLSGRELEVLRLLRGELSGPDIARELSVSVNTLRTHTKNIYTKLGVTNRREAVRRATELGL